MKQISFPLYFYFYSLLKIMKTATKSAGIVSIPDELHLRTAIRDTYVLVHQRDCTVTHRFIVPIPTLCRWRGALYMVLGLHFGSKKPQWSFDSFRGFIEKFSLFSNGSETVTMLLCPYRLYSVITRAWFYCNVFVIWFLSCYWLFVFVWAFRLFGSW